MKKDLIGQRNISEIAVIYWTLKQSLSSFWLVAMPTTRASRLPKQGFYSELLLTVI